MMSSCVTLFLPQSKGGDVALLLVQLAPQCDIGLQFSKVEPVLKSFCSRGCVC